MGFLEYFKTTLNKMHTNPFSQGTSDPQLGMKREIRLRISKVCDTVFTLELSI